VPVDDVWVFDASRQTKRISANVSGFLGTERISLNDNLLERTSLPEIEAVMGHELGHYVLGHVYELFLQIGLVLVLGFAFLRLTFDRTRRRWGQGWGIRGVDDPAGLPLLAAPAFGVVLPHDADAQHHHPQQRGGGRRFRPAVARQPEGFAEVALKLGEYRKLDPSPAEEWFFFDHPSGRSRIQRAMEWKAAELETP
jgi:STE24 endopeptidase